MQSWRVTKYDPALRDAEGAFLVDDWTAYSDVGRHFNGIELTPETYLATESLYIEAVTAAMQRLRIPHLRVSGLERHGDPLRYARWPLHYPDHMLRLYAEIEEGDELNIQEVEDLCRLVLREDLWCKLESSSLHVHFGYDYYMYIVSAEPIDDLMAQVKQAGLFPEPFLSPYLEEPEEGE